MRPTLSLVPPSPVGTYHVTSRRLAPYVLRALFEAQLEGTRCMLDELCARYPVRRSDLRRTLTALFLNDLIDLVTGRLTLTGFAVARALLPYSARPIRDALVLSNERAASSDEPAPAAPSTELRRVG